MVTGSSDARRRGRAVDLSGRGGRVQKAGGWRMANGRSVASHGRMCGLMKGGGAIKYAKRHVCIDCGVVGGCHAMPRHACQMPCHGHGGTGGVPDSNARLGSNPNSTHRVTVCRAFRGGRLPLPLSLSLSLPLPLPGAADTACAGRGSGTPRSAEYVTNRTARRRLGGASP